MKFSNIYKHYPRFKSMVQEISKKFIVFGITAALLILSFWIMRPILIATISGLILAYIFYPVYLRVLKIVREKNISSLIVVLLFLLIIFLPVWFLFPMVMRQIFDVYIYSQKVDLVGSLRTLFPPEFSTDAMSVVHTVVSSSINTVFNQATNFLTNVATILLQFVVVIFIFFFGMRDADNLKEYVKGISPFSKELESSLEEQFKGITNSVIYGHIIVGVLQGILTGIGLFIAGVPNVLMLTFIAIIASVIPVIGAWLVWIPASIYLFISGHTGSATFLVLYGAIFVSWIDNFLRPYIVSKRAKISSAVVLVGMIGGLIVFGIIGLVIGPLILAYLLVLLEAYKNKKLFEFFSK